MTDTSRYVCESCGESFEHRGGKGAHVKWNHPEATSEDTIINEIQRLAAEKGRPPRIVEMDDEGRCAGNTVRRIFGSWEDAVRAAEITPIHRHGVPERELLDDIRSVARQLGRPPTAAEYDAQGIVSRRTAQERFGGWNEALKQAGFTPHIIKNIPEEELLDEIQHLADKLGQTPTSVNMNERGKFSQRAYFRRFGTWRAAVRAAGYEPRGYPTGSDVHNWVEESDYVAIYYGRIGRSDANRH